MAACCLASFDHALADTVTITLVNGRPSSAIDVSNRGLAYGDGVFETIKVHQGVAEFYPLHRQRLQRGCQRLKIACDIAAIDADVSRLLVGIDGAAVLKITVTRAAAGRGYKPHPSAGSDRIVALMPGSQDYSRQQLTGVKLRLCDSRLAINPALAGIKHLSRLENVLARAEWHDTDIDEGIMLDTSGRVIEGTMSNLFLVAGGCLITPLLHRCGVEGIVRQLIIDRLSSSLGIAYHKKDVTVSELIRAEEMLVCNSLIGIWPVIAIGCHAKTIGPVTRQLQQALSAESLCHE